MGALGSQRLCGQQRLSLRQVRQNWGGVGAGCPVPPGAEGRDRSSWGGVKEQGLLTQRPPNKDAGEETGGLVPQHGQGRFRKPAVSLRGDESFTTKWDQDGMVRVAYISVQNRIKNHPYCHH